VELRVSSKREELEQQGLPAGALEKTLEEFREAEIKAVKMAKATAAHNKKAGGHAPSEGENPAEGGDVEADDAAGASAQAMEDTQKPSSKAEAELGAGAESLAEAEVKAEAGVKAEAEVVAELVAGAACAAEAAAEPKGEGELAAGAEASAEAEAKKTDGKARAAHGAKPPASAKPPPGKPHKPLKSIVIDGPNKDYLSEVQDDISTILRSKLFKDIAQEDPLPISKDAECGIQEPFDAEQCKTALSRRGTYIAGFNFFWLDLLRSLTPGIPLSRERVWELANFMFQDGPTALKKPIGVTVSSADFLVEAQRGSLLMITPEEKAHAILLKVAEDTRQGAKRSKQWKLVLLSVPVYIDVNVKEEQLQWEAFNARQLVF